MKRRGRHCAKPAHASHHTPLPSLPFAVPIQSKQARLEFGQFLNDKIYFPFQVRGCAQVREGMGCIDSM